MLVPFLLLEGRWGEVGVTWLLFGVVVVLPLRQVAMQEPQYSEEEGLIRISVRKDQFTYRITNITEWYRYLIGSWKKIILNNFHAKQCLFLVLRGRPVSLYCPSAQLGQYRPDRVIPPPNGKLRYAFWTSQSEGSFFVHQVSERKRHQFIQQILLLILLQYCIVFSSVISINTITTN